MEVSFVSTGTLCCDIATRGVPRPSGAKSFMQTACDYASFPVGSPEEAKDIWDKILQQSHDAPEAVGGSGTLSKEDIKALAEKYNVSDMTQEEYDAFLDDLYERGLLTEEDLTALGHSEYKGMFRRLKPEEMCGAYLANCADFPAIGWQPGFALGQKHVDMLSMAQYEKSFQYFDEEKSEWLQSPKAVLYQKLYDVLYAMSMYQ